MIIQKQANCGDLPMPSRETAYSSGFDLRAAEDAVIEPGEWALIGTGYAWQLAEGNVGMVCPRSGLANKHGVTVLNGPGIVDPDYRGEVKVMLINHGKEIFEVKRGDRIAQMVVTQQPCYMQLHLAKDLSVTERGEGGFGSTGTS